MLATGWGCSSPRGRSRTGAHGSRATSFPDVTRFQCPKQRGTSSGVLLAGRRTRGEDKSLRERNRCGANVATARPKKTSRRACTPKARVPEGESGLITPDEARRRELRPYKRLRNRLAGASRGAVLEKPRGAAEARGYAAETHSAHRAPRVKPGALDGIAAAAGVRMKLSRLIAKIHVKLVS